MEDDIHDKKSGNNITASHAEEVVIPVIMEELVTGKKIVERATILIEKTVRTEEVQVDIPLTSEEYQVERIEKNQFVEDAPEIRYEGESIIIPVVKEVLVKRLLVTEEIRITRKRTTSDKTAKVNLRKEEVSVSRKENK